MDGPLLILYFFSGPTFTKYYNFFHGLRIFSSFGGFFNTSLHILFQALHLLLLPNFPGPMFIPCPTSVSDSRVRIVLNFFLKITPKFSIFGALTLEQSQ